MVAQPSGQNKPTFSVLLDEHILLVATVIYVLVSIPVYVWFEGPVGTAGTVDPTVVIGALILGSIIFIPAIMAGLRNQRLKWGFGKNEESPAGQQ